jgi:hypothetical protein
MPTLNALDIPEQEYFKVLGDAPISPAPIEISVPTRITLDDWSRELPAFSAKAPVNNVDWSYDSFTTEFRDALTTLFADFTRSENTKSFFDLLNKSILENEVDCLTERGNVNLVETRISRELRLLEGDFKSFQEIKDHDLEWDYKNSEIENRQENERILRDQEISKQSLQFQFADVVAKNWVKNYSACITAYNNQVTQYALKAEEYQARIQANGLRLQIMSKELEISQDIRAYNASLVAVFDAEAASNSSLIDLFKTQMAVSKRLLSLELIELELFQVEIEAFTVTVRALEGQSRELEAFAQADGIIAETTIAPSLQSELNAQISVAQAELDVEQVKFTAARDVYEARERAVNAEIRTFSDGLSSQGDLIQSQVELAHERAKLSKEERQFGARSAEDRRNTNFFDKRSQEQLNEDRQKFLGTLEDRRDELLGTDREFEVNVNDAEFDAVQQFASAKIVNTLTHVIN